MGGARSVRQGVGFTLFKGACRRRGSTRMARLLRVLQHGRTRVYVRHRFCRFLHLRAGTSLAGLRVFGNRSFATSVTLDMKKSNAFLGATDLINGGRVPVLNVGAKQLNFLTSVSPSRVRRAFSRVCRKVCLTRPQQMLGLAYGNRMLGNCPCKLGRVTVLGQSDSSVVAVHTCVGKRLLGICRTSKLVITAPANSANCSLDMNNPVLMPRDNAVDLAPMTPRDLGIHPVIVHSR